MLNHKYCFTLGLSQFAAITEVLKEFEIADHVHIVCFDTTPSNTGLIKGAIHRLDFNQKDMTCR